VSVLLNRQKGPTELATGTIRRRLLAPILTDLRGLRDRATLLVGFAGALRRSELAAIRVEHLEKTDRGICLTLQHSKGAQDSAVTVPLPYGDTELCPVHALPVHALEAGCRPPPSPRRGPGLPADLAGAAPEEGRASRSPASRASGPSPAQIGTAAITPQTVAQVVQTRAVMARFELRELGGHSLSRGALTTAMDRGVHPAKLKQLGRHKSFDVLGDYLEFGDLFEGHPLSGVLRRTPGEGGPRRRGRCDSAGWKLFQPPVADRHASDGVGAHTLAACPRPWPLNPQFKR